MGAIGTFLDMDGLAGYRQLLPVSSLYLAAPAGAPESSAFRVYGFGV